MLKRGETPNAFIVYFSICSLMYKNPPRVRPGRLLAWFEEWGPSDGFIWSVLCLSLLLQQFFF